MRKYGLGEATLRSFHHRQRVATDPPSSDDAHSCRSSEGEQASERHASVVLDLYRRSNRTHVQQGRGTPPAGPGQDLAAPQIGMTGATTEPKSGARGPAVRLGTVPGAPHAVSTTRVPQEVSMLHQSLDELRLKAG